MNLRQKTYDSFDKTNKLLKITNSFYHNRNLELIRNRKSPYAQPQKYAHKRQYLEPFKDYYVIKENKVISKKLNNIRFKQVQPRVNDYYLEKEGKISDYRKKHQIIADSLRDKENDKYRDRINQQKAFIDPAKMDEEYEINHEKMMRKLRRLGGGENIVLPPIRDGKKNPILQESQKHYATEGSKKEGSSSGDDSGTSEEKDSSGEKGEENEESEKKEKE